MDFYSICLSKSLLKPISPSSSIEQLRSSLLGELCIGISSVSMVDGYECQFTADGFELVWATPSPPNLWTWVLFALLLFISSAETWVPRLWSPPNVLFRPLKQNTHSRAASPWVLPACSIWLLQGKPIKDWKFHYHRIYEPSVCMNLQIGLRFNFFSHYCRNDCDSHLF